MSETSKMMRMASLILAAVSGGCVNVTAPSKPIEINLNVSVTQQVVLKYDEAAKSVIQQNPGIF